MPFMKKEKKEAHMFALSFKRWSSVVIFVSVLAGSASATHFTLADSNTAVTMIVFVDSLINPTINGLPMHKNDEIAVFDSNGNCYGRTVWDSVTTSFTVWGYNGNTNSPGMESGEKLHFRVWDTTAGEMAASVAYYPVGGRRQDSRTRARVQRTSRKRFRCLRVFPGFRPRLLRRFPHLQAVPRIRRPR
jgi:hypothetical protein